MPERQLTEQEIEWAKQQGLNPDDLVIQTADETSDRYSTTGAIGKSLQQKAGGIAGAGIGALGAPALYGALVGGPPGFLGGLALGVGGALAGGYAGQQAQEAIEGEETAKRLALEAQAAQEQHPIATGAADLTASMIASGGAFSPATALRGGRAALAKLAGKEITKEAAEDLANVGIQSAVMPAINTGIELATTGEFPTAGRLASDVVGGALFAKPGFLGRKVHELTYGKPEVRQEPTVKTETTEPKTESEVKPTITDFTAIDEAGRHVIGDSEIKQAYISKLKKVDPKDYPDYLDNPEYLKAKTAYKREVSIPVSEMRQKLHENAVKMAQVEKAISRPAEVTLPGVEAKGEPTKKITSETATPVKTEIPGPVVETARNVEELRTPKVDPLEQQKIEDFKKAQQELALQKADEVLESAKKPAWTENQRRLLDPKTILPSAIDRPQTPLPPKVAEETGVDPNRYASKDEQARPTEKVSVGKTVAEHLEVLKQHPTLGPLARALKIDEQSLAAPVMVHGKGFWEHYQPSKDTIHIGEDSKPEHILHEIIHAATTKKLDAMAGTNHPLMRELIDLLHEAQKHFNYSPINGPVTEAPHYGLKNIHEFVAESLSSSSFQDALNNIHGKQGNIWSRLVDAIRRLLGVDVKHGSLLERALKPIDELVQMERPGAAKAETEASSGNRYVGGKGEEEINRKHSSLMKRIEELKESVKYIPPGGETKTIYDRIDKLESEAASLLTGENRYAPPKSPTDTKLDPIIPKEMKQKGVSFLPTLTSRFDRVLKVHNNPIGAMVVDAFHKWHGDYDTWKGKWGNSIIPIIDKAKLSPEQVTKVLHYNHDFSLWGKSPIKLTPEEKSLSVAVKKHFRDIGVDIQKEGPGIHLPSGSVRAMKLKEEGYVPSILNQDVPYEWAQHPESEKSKAYAKAYTDHLEAMGHSPEESFKIWDDYRRALGNQYERDVAYKAIRRAEGEGLPWELIDQNLTSLTSRYADRAARDVAFFKHLQSKPEIRKALDLTDETGKRMTADQYPEITSIGGSDVTKDAMRSVLGHDIPQNPVFMAFARAAGNTVMGIGTAARNLVNLPAFALTYMQPSQWPMLARAVGHMSDSRVRALQTNAVKPNFQEAFDAAGYRRDDPNPVVNFLNKYSAFMRKHQGRDLSDKLEGEYLYSVGELLATDNIAKAQKGNVESRHFLKRFGDLVEGGPERLFKGEIKPRDVELLAKRFIDATRGTYSAEGLPGWAIEGSLAPFAALSKFSIEKSNTVWKDVIEPMKAGNYGPIVRYTLASLGIGVGIEQLNELLSNKRGPDPTVSETLADPSAENLVAKAIGLGQLASYAGIISDGAKAAMQMYQGKELRYNQPLSMPLYTLVTDTIMGNLKDAAAALQEGQDPFEVMGLLATTIAGQSVQTMRYLDANVLNPEEAKRKEKFRDVSVFQQMEGQRAGPAIKSNPYMGIEEKKFKRTGDIEEAMKMLPGLIQEAIKKSNGDPYELQRQLKGLKNNSYQTMPSFETVPASFLKYINRLKATQGEEAAQERLADYLRQKAVNQAKASAVP